MSTTEQIESLFKLGVVQINFGKSPEGDWLCEVRQAVDTGDKGQSHIVHQIAAPSVVQCLQKADIHAKHASDVPMFLTRKNSN